MLLQLRNTSIDHPVTQEIVQQLQRMIITPQDVIDRPEFLFAPVAVCGNAERNIINQEQAIRFGRYHHRKVIQWRCDLVGVATNFPTHIIDHIHEQNSSSLTSTFVYCAPAYLTEKINTLRQIVNGTPCTLHSCVPVSTAVSLESRTQGPAGQPAPCSAS